MLTTSPPLPCRVAVALLAAEYIEHWFAANRHTIPDPWLRWMLSPRFETVCAAIWENPDGFMEQFLRMKSV